MTQRLRSLYTAGTVSYVLHLLVAVGAMIPGGQWGPILLLVALTIDLLKRSEAVGTWQHSHFAWRIRSVVWCGLAYLLTSPLWLFFLWPGFLAWLIISIWFLVRIVRGFLAMTYERAMPY
jgi:uncharacterized membrane protein